MRAAFPNNNNRPAPPGGGEAASLARRQLVCVSERGVGLCVRARQTASASRSWIFVL